MSELKVENLTPAIGALVHDIDLNDPAVVERHGPALKQLLLDREVIFFRNQELSAPAQARVAEIFGHVPPARLSTMAVHPDHNAVCILEAKGKKTQATDTWHADLTYHDDPPIATCLYARIVPESGGDTIWSSMTSAYNALAPDMQRYVESLEVVHNWGASHVVSTMRAGPNGEAGYRKRREEFAPVTKPMVIRHPENGKKILYVNSLYNKEVPGLRIPESNALLTMLTSMAEVPE